MMVMKKVIFVPGFIGKLRDMQTFEKMLKDFDLVYFHYDTSLEEPLEKIAKQLRTFVNRMKLKKGKKISIIGFSAGGVVTDYYLKFLDNTKVDKFVSVHSPFKGTYLASIFNKRKGLQELRPKSAFLEKLARRKIKGVKVKNVYSKFDPVVPGDSGEGTNPKSHGFFIHTYAMHWKPIVKEVKDFLEE